MIIIRYLKLYNCLKIGLWHCMIQQGLGCCKSKQPVNHWLMNGVRSRLQGKINTVYSLDNKVIKLGDWNCWWVGWTLSCPKGIFFKLPKSKVIFLKKHLSLGLRASLSAYTGNLSLYMTTPLTETYQFNFPYWSSSTILSLLQTLQYAYIHTYIYIYIYIYMNFSTWTE